ncbi:MULTISPECIES: DUF1868 domain-containing protein [unclassified Phaeobacter]|uniref:DUF1868 domain-containing protein n=1 Tax=unclassified Phaeobacter TaxID=2621772 RepID=UPI003A893FC8
MPEGVGAGIVLDKDRIAERLSGVGRSAPYPESITAPGLGGKFTPDGQALPFPGNTFICHIPRHSRFFKALGAIQAGVKAHPLARYFAFLPPSSFHMTVFPGVCGSPLGYDGWPDGFSPEVKLAEITETFMARLNDVTGFERVTVKAVGLYHPCSILVNPAGPAHTAALWKMREKLQALTGLHRPDFLRYRFHVTLGYPLCWIPPNDAGRLVDAAADLFAKHFPGRADLTLGPVEFCQFKTMLNFDPVLFIRNVEASWK